LFASCSRRWLLLALLLVSLLSGGLSSCTTTRYYQQRTMFRLSTDANGVADTAKFRRVVNRVALNYRIHTNDLLNVQVFTNKGERIIDPNGELRFGPPGSGTVGSVPVTTGGGGNASGQRVPVPVSTQFLVQADGTVNLPMLPVPVNVLGLTLRQTDSLLQVRYREFYREPFIKTAVTNNRVIILGSPGGQVVSLPNDNMNLLEVLALAGGGDNGGGASGYARFGGRMDNIRIIRGDLKNPQVQFVNLSTLQGMRRGNLQVEPNDVIYIEPVRRPAQETLSDAGPVLSAIATLLSTVSIIIFLTK